MGIYAENISRLSFKELLENLENIERAIVETKLRIKKVERKIEKNILDYLNKNSK